MNHTWNTRLLEELNNRSFSFAIVDAVSSNDTDPQGHRSIYHTGVNSMNNKRCGKMK